jgi:uncharacterized membrane protein YecN with MAPEG domain
MTQPRNIRPSPQAVRANREYCMQTPIAAVALYAGLCGLISVWLIVVVSRWRGKTGIAIGDGGNLDLTRAMRGQANFTENAPLALILMLCMALLGAPAWVIHVFGIALVAGRVVHGLHFAAPGRPRWQRAAGATLTGLVVGFGSAGVVGHALWAMLAK